MTTVGAARDAYLARNGFSTTAYEDKWVHVKVLGIPIVFPNVPSRRRAIRFHDIHHVVTGYDTSLRGEAEIAAWEIAATLPDRGLEFFAAWVLNTSAFGVGLLIAPRRLYRAFVRGRHCTSLYKGGWSDELLARDVETLRRALGTDREYKATWRDRLAFAGFVAALQLPAIAIALAVLHLVR